ncbi:MAG: transglutaminase domain-containing protein [Deltaproteobacteria bacterium]|nr:transglutaminase domain-containing protein [Deltaproteobacteria bacterium]
MDPFLQATEAIDCDNPLIQDLAHKIIEGAPDVPGRARRLFYFVRDTIRYNPYSPFFLMDHYKATTTLRRGRGYCVQKAVLLVALARAAEIPAQLVFADIRNHQASERLVEMMGTDLFVFHGYVEWFLGGRRVQVTPAFETELCQGQGYPIVEFNGRKDAIFPPYDSRGRKFVEYVRHHGTFSDVPLDLILRGWEEAYGSERVREWKKTFHE